MLKPNEPKNNFPKSVCDQIDKLLDNRASAQDSRDFWEAMMGRSLRDSHGRAITVPMLTDYLLQSGRSSINPRFTQQLLERVRILGIKAEVAAICLDYAETSGLANFMLSQVSTTGNQNYHRELAFLQRGATLGCANAQAMLSFDFYIEYSQRFGVRAVPPITKVEAWNYLIEAANQGWERACCLLFTIYRNECDYWQPGYDLKKAIQYLEKALPSCEGRAEYEMAVLHLYNQYSDHEVVCLRNDPKALELLQTGASKEIQEPFANGKTLCMLQRMQKEKQALPVVVQNALTRMQLQKSLPEDMSCVLNYLSKIQCIDELRPLYAFFIADRTTYILSPVYTKIGDIIEKAPRVTSFFHYHNYLKLSPLIAALHEQTTVKSAADRGCANAEFLMHKNSQAYVAGKSSAYLLRAAEHGHASALYQLSRIFFAQGDKAKGHSLLNQACAQYHLPSIQEREQLEMFAPFEDVLLQLQGEQTNTDLVQHLLSCLNKMHQAPQGIPCFLERCIYFLCEHPQTLPPNQVYLKMVAWIKSHEFTDHFKLRLRGYLEREQQSPILSCLIAHISEHPFVEINKLLALQNSYAQSEALSVPPSRSPLQWIGDGLRHIVGGRQVVQEAGMDMPLLNNSHSAGRSRSYGATS